MLSSKIEEAFNKQINAEIFSAYLYLSMSTWLEAQGFKGMANWTRVQFHEELGHATRFMQFVNDRNGRVLLTKIEGPKTEWSSPLNVFEEVLEHEQKVTAKINDLVELATEKKDHAATAFLQWFVTEQVEEEASAQEIRDKLRLAGEATGVLLLIDRELGQRQAGG
jgi:ferritin